MSSPQPEIAKLCHQARTLRRTHLLAAHAQTYITRHPASARAWTYLGIALHKLRRPTHAANAFATALALARVQSSPNVVPLRQLLRVSQFLAALPVYQHHLHRRVPKPPSPTELLCGGWYADVLERHLEEGTLVFLRPYKQFRPPRPPPVISLSTCAIIDTGRRPRVYEYHPNGDPVGLISRYTRHDAARMCNINDLPRFPLAQATGGYHFQKKRIEALGCDCYDEEKAPCGTCASEEDDGFPLPVALFPKLPLPLPPATYTLGGPLLHVHVAEQGILPPDIHALLVDSLTRLGARRQDCPVRHYHNIIDPNIAAVNGLWVPTEFLVKTLPLADALGPLVDSFRHHTSGHALPYEVLQHIHDINGSPSYFVAELRSPIPDLDVHKYAPLHLAIQHVLTAALPLLANLQLPALLLPGPLQVVVKAQRIVLEEDEQYAGVWHEDGLREHVVAIVLYYYGISPSLSGGDMEFASKIPSPMWSGDGGGPYVYERDGVQEAIKDSIVKAAVRQGAMLVFSNYAMVHRVLPMIAKGAPGSRDFLALFIIDQQHPLPVPSDLGPRNEREVKRAELLCEQLQARGHFGLDDSQVYSTGNGCLSDLVWIRSGECVPVQSNFWADEDDDVVASIVSRLNMVPPVFGRGSSFLSELDMPSVQFNPTSKHVLNVIEANVATQLFVNTKTSEYRSTRHKPSNGIREVRVFNCIQEWLEQGLWTSDENMKQVIDSLD